DRGGARQGEKDHQDPPAASHGQDAGTLLRGAGTPALTGPNCHASRWLLPPFLTEAGAAAPSGARLGCLRRRPGVLGLAVEDDVRVGVLEGPIAVGDLGLELPRRPTRVPDEDPQAIHRLVTAEQ